VTAFSSADPALRHECDSRWCIHPAPERVSLDMTLPLLRRLAGQTPPLTITSAEEIATIEILMLAGHLDATLAAPVIAADGTRSRVATVHGVTRLGHWMLLHAPLPPVHRTSNFKV